MPPKFQGAIFLESSLESAEEVVAEEGLEPVLAEAVHVRYDLLTGGEVAGARQKGVCCGAEAAVAFEDFVDGVVAEPVENR